MPPLEIELMRKITTPDRRLLCQKSWVDEAMEVCLSFYEMLCVAAWHVPYRRRWFPCLPVAGRSSKAEEVVQHPSFIRATFGLEFKPPTVFFLIQVIPVIGFLFINKCNIKQSKISFALSSYLYRKVDHVWYFDVCIDVVLRPDLNFSSTCWHSCV